MSFFVIHAVYEHEMNRSLRLILLCQATSSIRLARTIVETTNDSVGSVTRSLLTGTSPNDLLIAPMLL